MRTFRSVLHLCVLGLFSLAASSQGAAMTELNGELRFPWSVAELPDGGFLVAEREGTLQHLAADGSVRAEILGVPAVYAKSQGGLFDVLLAQDFAASQTIYLSYAYGTPAANGTRIARAKLSGSALENLEVLFTVSPLKDTPVHYGGRLAWDPEGALLLTTGDGFDYREAAQDRASLLGKTLRLTAEGTPFPGNGASEGRPEVWTYGHRNPQGLVLTPDGAVWSHEHGPQGGDELNRLVAGENYGWPVATFGIDYNGARISPFERYPGMRDSAWHWTPSIGPSGLAYVPTPDAEAQGTFYLGGLAIPGLYAAERRGDQILAVEQRFRELTERIRDVRVASDGALLVLTDGEKGRLLRVLL
jgi:glucose/arabinose dehydrogenase